jgi:hypothetical protein
MMVEPLSMSMFASVDDMLKHLLSERNEAASTIQTLSASNAALEAEIERLREALKEHVTENVWNAYHIGIERDGRWMDGARSEGEWLASELGLPSGWNDASLVKSMLPGLVNRIIARAALSSPKGGQDE